MTSQISQILARNCADQKMIHHHFSRQNPRCSSIYLCITHQFNEFSLIFFRIECTEENEDAISKAPEVTNKREPLKTPKTYFFESLQKRRQKALTKSQSACRFLANAGPNLIRRGSTIRSDIFL